MKTENSQTQKSKKSLMRKVFSFKTLTYLLTGTLGSLIGIGVTLGVTYTVVSNTNYKYKEQAILQGKVVNTSWDKDADLYQIVPFTPTDLNEKEFQMWLINILPQIKYNNNKQISFWLDYLKTINTEKLADGSFKYDNLIKQLEQDKQTLDNDVDKYLETAKNGEYKKDITQYGSFIALGKLEEQFSQAIAPLNQIREDMYYNWTLKHLPEQLVEKFKKLYKEQRINPTEIGRYAFAYYYSQLTPKDVPPKPMILDFQFWKKSYQNTKGTVPYLISNFYHRIDPNYVSDYKLK